MTRRWLRFSVRSLLILITLCGLAFGTYTIFIRSHIQAYHREQQMLADLQKLGGVTAEMYPIGPAWLLSWKSGKYARRVVELDIDSQAFSEQPLKKIPVFSRLGFLRIANGQPIGDKALATLAEIPALRGLSLVHTPVHHTGTGALGRLKLNRLTVEAGGFTENDARWIGELEGLTHLRLLAPVTDSNLPQLLAAAPIEELTIQSGGVTDSGLAHVASLSNLRQLELECPVTDAGMPQLVSLHKLERLICRPDPNGSFLVDKLLMSVRARFQETPLTDAVRVMSKITKLPMRLDEAALHAAEIPAEDVRLTVDEQGGDLRRALGAMLTPHGLAYVMESGGLLITTKAEAARRRPGLTRLLEANPTLEAYAPW